MKKFAVLFLVVALVAAFTAPGFAKISGSAHDFTANTSITAVTGQGDEVCKACHVPHNAIASVDNGGTSFDVSGILWAKDYGTPAVTGRTLTVRNSVLCMGCHDGTISDNAAPIQPTPYTFSGPANLGTDLSNDHPVDVLYSYEDTSKPYAKTSFVPTADIKTAGIRLYTSSTSQANTVACQSCHDVHGKKDPSSATGADIPNFLRVNNSASKLCLTCHVK